MNNFEKRKFLDYLEKLLPRTDLTHYEFDNVIDFLVKEFHISKNLLPRDEDGILLTDTRKERDNLKKLLKEIIKNKKSAIIPQKTTLEKQLLIIKNIYELSPEEFEIMTFLILKEINNVFNSYYDTIEQSTVETFCRFYLKIRYGRKERIMESLYLKHIIDGKRSDSINPEILKVFDNLKCNTVEKIACTLMGKPEKSSLKLTDYTHLKDELQKVIKLLTSATEKKVKGINILLYGGVGTGKTEFARLVANCAKTPMYAVKTQEDNYREADRENRLVDLYEKQHLLATLKKACILFDEGEDVMNRGFSSNGNASKGYMNNLLENTIVPIIWTTNNICDVDPAFLRRMTYCVEFEKLNEEMRLNIWNKVLRKNRLKVNKEKVKELNKNYEIPPSLISNAIQTTKMIGGNENDFEHFIENVAKVVTKKKNVKKKKEFEMSAYDENLVNADYDIKDLTQKIKQCGRLNFSLCLYGEPGTGKSLYARYLAKQLGIEVLMKRASDLISPFVGETEQRIAEAFAEAKSKKAMLIFDEADTFLQNRNNAVRSWEISQVNEMLTQMEAHEYPFVCTTNLLDTLDEASLRRFTFKIKFDFLSKEQVNNAMERFFNICDTNINIKGLTAGDFATVKKKVDFLEINDVEEISKMLLEEVKVKKSKDLKSSIGF